MENKKVGYIPRYIERHLLKDLARKMVFVAGPRQVGKTTMAKVLCAAGGAEVSTRYLDWDDPRDRENILLERFPTGPGLIVLDEIHKFKRWRQVLKGLFDKRGDELQILVTGSARLDYCRKGGDSLQGRYCFCRLFPFSVAETALPPSEALNRLLKYGGFPEPFLLASERETRRWSRAYRSRVVREDLRDLENVRDIDLIERMALRLPDLVGSPLSLNSIREDLQVFHQSVSRWMTMLENLYVFFRIYPYGAPNIRAVKKEAKHYHWDWTIVKDEAARFENLVACQLMKWCCFFQDTEGRDLDLRYFRDIDKREVDFVLVEETKPVHLIECKLNDMKPSNGLKYLKRHFPQVPATQLVLDSDVDVITKEGIRICSASRFLEGLT
ncbi:MAG: ATP-binding protein [Deltaproteobacteria bacterium]|nr:ATP-binding protein [Deltaproteobacteria bacterium]